MSNRSFITYETTTTPTDNVQEGDIWLNPSSNVLSTYRNVAWGGMTNTVIIGVKLESNSMGGTWSQIDSTGATITAKDTTWFNSFNPTNLTDVTTSDGQAMVRVNKFWYKQGYADTTKPAVWISNVATPGFNVHPAFIVNGVEKDFFLFGKYQAVLDAGAGSNLCSLNVGTQPTVGLTLSGFRTYAAARNVSGVTGYQIVSWHMWSAIQMLFLVENRSMNSQSISPGNSTSGSLQSVNSTLNLAATYRGITGLWGNINQLLEGLYLTSGLISIRNSPLESWISSGQTIVNMNHWYGNTWRTGTLDGGFIAQDSNGGSATVAVIPDDQTISSGDPINTAYPGPYCVGVGGYYYYDTGAGLWSMQGIYDPTGTSNGYTGSRLAKI